jgi:hypothetical protein
MVLECVITLVIIMTAFYDGMNCDRKREIVPIICNSITVSQSFSQSGHTSNVYNVQSPGVRVCVVDC